LSGLVIELPQSLSREEQQKQLRNLAARGQSLGEPSRVSTVRRKTMRKRSSVRSTDAFSSSRCRRTALSAADRFHSDRPQVMTPL
jgi:hypothetical protein